VGLPLPMIQSFGDKGRNMTTIGWCPRGL